MCRAGPFGSGGQPTLPCGMPWARLSGRCHRRPSLEFRPCPTKARAGWFGPFCSLLSSLRCLGGWLLPVGHHWSSDHVRRRLGQAILARFAGFFGFVVLGRLLWPVFSFLLAFRSSIGCFGLFCSFLLVFMCSEVRFVLFCLAFGAREADLALFSWLFSQWSLRGGLGKPDPRVWLALSDF